MADATFPGFLNILAAAGGLGTASMGLVDASKAFAGGPSNFGFRNIKNTLQPFLDPLALGATPSAQADILQTLKANWVNGVPKADQKAKAKSLIHLGLTQGSAPALAAAAGVDAHKLESLAKKTAAGKPVTQEELNVLGQFDAVLSAVLDAAYERGDQQYRNGSKFMAMAVSTILGVVAGWIVFRNDPGGYWWTGNFALSFVIGISATPLAPVAKDLASSLQAAVSAVGLVKR